MKWRINKDNDIPSINHITMVDSRYTPAIQILDIVSEYFSKIKNIEENNETKIKLKTFW